MGLILEKDNIQFTNEKGDPKFTLDKKIPHIIHVLEGTVEVPLISTEPATQIERTDTLGITNNLISINNESGLILPFYTISGGCADTGGKTMCGIGSTVIRKITQNGTQVGSSILKVITDNGILKILCDQNLESNGQYEGDVPVTVTYKIYYGRFKE